MPNLVAENWPNLLGYNILDAARNEVAEVWKHRECLRVFTDTKALCVSYTVWRAGKPIQAVLI